MVIGPPRTIGALIVVTMVVSVGPYTLYSERPGAQRSTSSGGHASPPTRMCRSDVALAGSAVDNAAVVMKACVMRSDPSRSLSSRPP